MRRSLRGFDHLVLAPRLRREPGEPGRPHAVAAAAKAANAAEVLAMRPDVVIIATPEMPPIRLSLIVHFECTMRRASGESVTLVATAVRVTVSDGVVRALRAAKKSDPPNKSAAMTAKVRARLMRSRP